MGVASLEVTLPAERCCTFRGSIVKLDIQTGAVLWQTYTIPDNGGKLGGYSGAAVWGSSPAIDPKRNLVFIGTGNLYNAPAEVQQCQATRNNQTIPPQSQPDQCIPPDVHFDSILALELHSGKIKWFRQFGGYDVFYFVCLVPNNPACPVGPNLDADFGESPMLLTVFPNGTKLDIVVAVQKSGFAWALDRDTGDTVWFNVSIFLFFIFITGRSNYNKVIVNYYGLGGWAGRSGRRSSVGRGHRREKGVHEHRE